MPKTNQLGMQIAVNALMERFDDIEELTGADFRHAKKIILKWARDNKVFPDPTNFSLQR